MDKRVFALDRTAVDAEIERLAPLVDLGGYIPCPDHRIPLEAEWDLVRYLRAHAAGLRGLRPHPFDQDQKPLVASAAVSCLGFPPFFPLCPKNPNPPASNPT